MSKKKMTSALPTPSEVQALVAQIAAHDIFGQFRFIEKDNGEIWFVGIDVCKILGYKNGSRDVKRHVDPEDREVVELSTETVLNSRGNPKKIIINESGLYSLILGSQLPEAKKFTRWVTSEVLPAIRKTGKYELPKKKAVKEISYEEFFTALFEVYPDAEPEITGISFSEDENGNVFTHYHVNYMLPDGNFVDPEKVAKKILGI